MIVYETAAAYVQPLHQRSCKGWETRRLFVFLETSQGSEIAGKKFNTTMCGSKNLLRMATEIFRVKR